LIGKKKAKEGEILNPKSIEKMIPNKKNSNQNKEE
jgi:hypothetical protein